MQIDGKTFGRGPASQARRKLFPCPAGLIVGQLFSPAAALATAIFATQGHALAINCWFLCKFVTRQWPTGSCVTLPHSSALLLSPSSLRCVAPKSFCLPHRALPAVAPALTCVKVCAVTVILASARSKVTHALPTPCSRTLSHLLWYIAKQVLWLWH